MSEIAIKVENLSKSYRLLTQGQQKHSLKSLLLSPLKNFRDAASLTSRNNANSFWALKDINFEVKKGEVVGIIGHNGAGKTTLLKVLSKITSPSSGKVEIYGRVNALLAVGTGFNPNLTGRENIYMNGTIHGMSKVDIDRKLDEIIDFSGVEKFIDMPIKRYSSGMSVRLGFAVAAHLEPEILIVDEVLAVGDVGFQKKCMAKVENVANEGRTVLIVSHQMGSIKSLTSRSLLMCNGEITFDGTTDESISRYYEQFEGDSKNALMSSNNKDFDITNIRITNKKGEVTDSFSSSESMVVEIQYNAKTDIKAPSFGLNIDGPHGKLASIYQAYEMDLQDLKAGSGTIRCVIEQLPFYENQIYSLMLYANDSTGASFVQPTAICRFSINDEVEGERYGATHKWGSVKLLNHWSIS